MAVNRPITARSEPILTWTLGLLALVPFLAGCYVAIAFNGNIADRTLEWLVVYASTIVSFIGGVQWGLQIAEKQARLVGMSAAVCPALIAWVGVMLGVMWGQTWSFALVLSALVVAWLADENGGRQGWVPGYFLTLRRTLTVIVAACLAVVGGAALFG